MQLRRITFSMTKRNHNQVCLVIKILEINRRMKLRLKIRLLSFASKCQEKVKTWCIHDSLTILYHLYWWNTIGEDINCKYIEEWPFHSGFMASYIMLNLDCSNRYIWRFGKGRGKPNLFFVALAIIKVHNW